MIKKMIKKMAAQGDLLVRRISKVPPGTEQCSPTGSHHIVAHSETGHHHVLPAAGVRVSAAPGNALVSYVEVLCAEATLEHLRAWDQHAPLVLARGTYELRRQREYTPGGWRRVED